MRGSKKLVSILLVLCLTLGALPLAMAEEVVDADLTCTITLGNWPADTAAEAEKALFESYRETMKKQYPNVTLVPDYYSYTLSSYVPMAKGGTAPSIFQPPFTDPQLLISQHLVGEVAEYGQIIREKTGKAGLVFPASETYGGWLFTNIAWNFGCVGENALEYQDEDGRWVCNFTSDECVAAMEYIRDLRWKYNILNADATTTDWAGAHSLLGTGEAAMNFAADDSVDQPTSNKGLPVEDFALIPFPAGDAGRYALAGGTCYMFAPNITEDQATALMAYLTVLGKMPYLNDQIIEGMRADYAAKRDRGAPVLPAISAWNDEDYNAAKQAIIDEYCNVDMRLYNDFFDSITQGTITLRSEEPVFAQQLYRELTAVIQRVITREGADVRKALQKAQDSFQEYLDDEINDY